MKEKHLKRETRQPAYAPGPSGESSDPRSAPVDSAALAEWSLGILGGLGVREGAAEVFADDFLVLGEIGQGGMGKVFRAQQFSIHRVVALKLLDKDRFKPELAEWLLQAEAEAVARLDHSHIIPIYETGEAEGQCYLSMKLIEGGDLAEWAAALPAVTDGRAAMRRQREIAHLVSRVAQAVHHAHSRGVIHRDLKPGNILVDDAGEPWVTDFGLAKVMETKTAVSQVLTDLGTAAYMAPEQAGGDSRSVSTATDVWALGVILYELLTGVRPFEAASDVEIRDFIRTREPARPSALHPEISRDLETICLKCLEKEPGRRYSSAQALAEDFGRWLRYEPILARPVAAVDRLRKWAQRKPGVAALTAALAVAVGIGFVAVLWQLQLKEQARTQAVHARTLADENFANALAANVESLTQLADDSRLKEADFFNLRQELLGKGIRSLEALAHRQTEKATPELMRQRGRAFLALARVQNDLNRMAEAKTNALIARSFFHALAQSQPGSNQTLRDLVESIARLAGAEWKLGQLSEAESLCREAIATNFFLVRNFSNDPTNRLKWARSFSGLSYVLADLNRDRESEEAVRAALTNAALLVQTHPITEVFRVELADTLNDLAITVARDKSRLGEATNLLGQAVIQAQELVRANASTENQALLARSWHHLADAYFHQGRYAETMSAIREAVLAWKKLTAQFPTVASYQRGLAGAHRGLSRVEVSSGDWDAGLASFAKATNILAEITSRFPADVEAKDVLAQLCSSMASDLSSNGRAAESVSLLEKVVALQQELTNSVPNSPSYYSGLALTHSTLAHSYETVGQPVLAERCHRESLRLAKLVAAERPAVVSFQNSVVTSAIGLAGFLKSDTNRLGEAEEILREAGAWAGRTLTNSPGQREIQASFGGLQLILGGVLLKKRDFKDAEKVLQEALSIYQGLTNAFPAVPYYRANLANTYIRLSEVAIGQDEPSRAIDFQLRAILIRERLTNDLPASVSAKRILAEDYESMGNLLAPQNVPDALTNFYNAEKIFSALADRFPEAPGYTKSRARIRTRIDQLRAAESKP